MNGWTMCNIQRVSPPPRLPVKMSTSSTTSSSSRKRVRFESSEDEEALLFAAVSNSSTTDNNSNSNCNSNNSNKKQRILEWLPLCKELSLEEKQERWIQRDERNAMRHAANVQAALCHQQDASRGGLSTAQTYAHVYAICQDCSRDYSNDDNNNNNSPPCSRSFLTDRDEHDQVEPDQVDQDCGTIDIDTTTTTQVHVLLPKLLSSMAEHKSDTRGLEDRVVPWLALERRIARAKAIRTILQAQTMCNTEDVRTLSRVLSQPSRRLGQVLAVADATAAMAEYGTVEQQKHLQKQQPHHHHQKQKTVKRSCAA